MIQAAQSYALLLSELRRLIGQHGKFFGLWISPSLSPAWVALNIPASHAIKQQLPLSLQLALKSQLAPGA